jgi:hypothetical protein
MKDYQVENREVLAQQQKQHYRENREELKAKRKKYYDENTEKALECSRLSREKNKSYHNSRKYKSDTYRELFDINYKLSCRLRNRLGTALRAQRAGKPGSAVGDLGCTVEYLVTYLAERFTEGMTWENYGEWHIDHIKPLCSFNLQDPTELAKACHYTNLQPLWGEENLSKGSR